MAEKKEKGEKKEEAPKETQYTVSLVPVYRAPRPKRAFRAINFLRKFIFKHLRVSADNVSISQALNQAIWAKGREHIPRKIKIKVLKEGEKANVYLASEKIKKPVKEKKKGEKEEKTPEEKEEIEKKKEEKKAKEKAADAAEIKRGKGK